MRRLPELLYRVLYAVSRGDVENIESVPIDLSPEGMAMLYILFFGKLDEGTVFCLGYDNKEGRHERHFLAVGPGRDYIKECIRHPTLAKPSFLKEGSEGVKMIEPIPLLECQNSQRRVEAQAYNSLLRNVLEQLCDTITR